MEHKTSLVISDPFAETRGRSICPRSPNDRAVKPHVFHPDAGEEYAQAIQYYAAVAPELGSRLYDEIERLILEVRRQPESFFLFSPPARRALARKFPYAVVYLDEPDRVWIVAIMHAKRKPGYWRERLI